MLKRITQSIKTRKFEYFLLALMLFLGLFIRLYKINAPLADWHSWRQADTASVTRIYLDEGVNLLYPRYYDISSIQSRLPNPNGYRFVEFPIYNLLHIVSYQLVPFVTFEGAGRFVTIFASLLSGVSLFYIGKTLMGRWGGFLSAGFFLLLPYYWFFGRVILPDPLSTMFGLLATVSMLKFSKTKNIVYLFGSAVSFAFALLVKPHAIFFGIPITYLLLSTYPLKKVLRMKSSWVALLVVVVPVLLWRYWVGLHPEGVPLWRWSFNGDGIRFRPSFWRWIFGERLAKIILGYWGLVPFAVGIMMLKKKIELVHVFLSAALLYVVIFATANVKHDYYQIFVMPAISLTLAWGTITIWNLKAFDSILRRGVILFSIGMMFLMSYYQVRDQFQIINDSILRAGEAVDRVVPLDAKVIAPYNGDTAFLYQTKRFGWPAVTGSIDDMLREGADYYVSISKHDPDTMKFSAQFVTLEETDEYIIIDLSKRKQS